MYGNQSTQALQVYKLSAILFALIKYTVMIFLTLLAIGNFIFSLFVVVCVCLFGGMGRGGGDEKRKCILLSCAFPNISQESPKKEFKANTWAFRMSFSGFLCKSLV